MFKFQTESYTQLIVQLYRLKQSVSKFSTGGEAFTKLD